MPETTRTQVIDGVGCPLCGAEPGEPCWGVQRRNGRRRRKRCHAERWQAAAELRDAARREDTERKLALLEAFTNRRSGAVVDSTAEEITDATESLPYVPVVDCPGGKEGTADGQDGR